jgi:hypothetical protein
VDQMLASWHDMLPAKMKEWGLQRGEVSRGKPSVYLVGADHLV